MTGEGRRGGRERMEEGREIEEEEEEEEEQQQQENFRRVLD